MQNLMFSLQHNENYVVNDVCRCTLKTLHQYSRYITPCDSDKESRDEGRNYKSEQRHSLTLEVVL